MKRYLFTDGHKKIQTIKYQTESPNIRWWGAVDSVGLGDRRGCDECKELLESEQWLAL
jgi:hypothetical protein